jgi:methyltransferase family protein
MPLFISRYYHALRGCAGEALKLASEFPRVLKMLLCKLFHRSDYKRWTDPHSLESWWDTRTEKIAQFIPKNTRVLEFGAGRRQLERLLDGSCTYIPSDLIDRGPGTLIFDLNRRPLPDLCYVNADVAIFSGVLEYILDLESLVAWLSDQVSCCIASYAYVSTDHNASQRIRSKIDRIFYGYMNSYTDDELVKLFNRYGFICIKKDLWTSQYIFMFDNQSTKAPSHASKYATSFTPVINSDFDNFTIYHPLSHAL